jgi:hypothetical protein
MAAGSGWGAGRPSSSPKVTTNVTAPGHIAIINLHVNLIMKPEMEITITINVPVVFMAW